MCHLTAIVIAPSTSKPFAAPITRLHVTIFVLPQIDERRGT